MTVEKIEEKKCIKTFAPNDLVKSCELIERGMRFWIKGLCCCSAITLQSPMLITAEEMSKGNITYDLIVERRRQLFEALNGLNDGNVGDCAKCELVKEKLYKDVDFTRLGGLGADCECSSFNISHFSTCNLRCKYCDYTIRNDFVPPQYHNIIEIVEEFRKRDKLLYPNSLDYNGGEPTLLSNFDEILNYFVDNKVADVTLYSNCVKYADSIYKALKGNKINLLTSLDAGTPESYKEIHGADAFQKVVNNIIKYQKSGTNRLIIKYNICKDNVTEADLFGFVFLMAAIKPAVIFISPEFPYGDMEIPQKTVEFGARMFCLLKKYMGIVAHIQTDVMKTDIKLIQYSVDIRKEIAKIEEKETYPSELNLNPDSCDCLTKYHYIFKQPTFLQQIFSIRNEGRHKVLRVLGIKMKFNRKIKKA